jgi:hypothetical protein
MQIIINPFYAARNLPSGMQAKMIRESRNSASLPEPVYAKLPRAPRNSSPVPSLTSLYHNSRAGDYGDRSYPGNCGGNLIRDLLLYFTPGNVFDPMTGSGTCRDVCRELEIDCWSTDLHEDFDLCNPKHFIGETRMFDAGTFDFIWLHPPYWRQKIYSQDTRDLSCAATLDEFLHRYGQAIAHCVHFLAPGGKLCILMGDYSDREAGFIPLVYHTKRLAFEVGLRQHCTDIVRFSHGATSSKKVYRSSFIPGLHDICAIFEKQADRM